MYKMFFALNLCMVSFLIFFYSISTINEYKQVDPDLKPYTDKYFNLLTSYCPNKKYNTTNHYSISLVKSMDQPEWIGVCDRRNFSYSIQIYQRWWDQALEEDRQQLIYHEMAHCLINQEHSKDPYNYMYPSFRNLSVDIYTAEAIDDIKDYCQ